MKLIIKTFPKIMELAKKLSKKDLKQLISQLEELLTDDINERYY